MPGLPEEFVCPLSGVLMTDPIRLETGAVFQREAIHDWLLGWETGPISPAMAPTHCTFRRCSFRFSPRKIEAGLCVHHLARGAQIPFLLWPLSVRVYIRAVSLTNVNAWLCVAGTISALRRTARCGTLAWCRTPPSRKRLKTGSRSVPRPAPQQAHLPPWAHCRLRQSRPDPPPGGRITAVTATLSRVLPPQSSTAALLPKDLRPAAKSQSAPARSCRTQGHFLFPARTLLLPGRPGLRLPEISGQGQVPIRRPLRTVQPLPCMACSPATLTITPGVLVRALLSSAQA